MDCNSEPQTPLHDEVGVDAIDVTVQVESLERECSIRSTEVTLKIYTTVVHSTAANFPQNESHHSCLKVEWVDLHHILDF